MRRLPTIICYESIKIKYILKQNILFSNKIEIFIFLRVRFDQNDYN